MPFPEDFFRDLAFYSGCAEGDCVTAEYLTFKDPRTVTSSWALTDGRSMPLLYEQESPSLRLMGT